MPKKYKLEEVADGGTLRDIGMLDNELVPIGRDEDFGIHLESEAVSGEHGMFLPFGNHWLFKDLGSTNGSWLNEKKLSEGDPVLIRPGDILQLADRVLKISSIGDVGLGVGGAIPPPPSLLVFSRGEPVEEYPIPQQGRALSIGGSKGDLKFDVDVYELPSLVIEGRGDSIVAYSVAKDIEAKLNGRRLDRALNVVDRDELTAEHYRIIVSDPPRQTRLNLTASDDLHEEGQGRQFGSAGRTLVNLPFGRKGEPAPMDEWEESSTGKMRGFDGHPGMRTAMPTESGEIYEAVEDKIVRYIGLGLLIACVVLVLVWLVL